MSESQELLKNILLRLEKVTDEVSKTQGYTAETEKLRLLLEMTREQVKHEDSDHSAR